MPTEQILRIALFLILSAWLAYFSRASLRRPRSHGFYRFFAWEFILGLFLLNIKQWFSHPFSHLQITSWVFLFISAFLVLHAVHVLRKYGHPDDEKRAEPLIGFEKTTQLVTRGVYRYIRHPMYSSLLFLTWGIYFKNPGLSAGILAAAASGFLVATARADEVENMRFFGSAYLEYKKRTKLFIPFLY